MKQQANHLKELYRTLNGCIYQDNRHNVMVLEWYGQQSLLKLPCYFSLKKLVDKVDLEKILSATDSTADVEILNPCGCDRCFVLTPLELIEFKDLLNGSRFTMELNSLLHERLHRAASCFG